MLTCLVLEVIDSDHRKHMFFGIFLRRSSLLLRRETFSGGPKNCIDTLFCTTERLEQRQIAYKTPGYLQDKQQLVVQNLSKYCFAIFFN